MRRSPRPTTSRASGRSSPSRARRRWTGSTSRSSPSPSARTTSSASAAWSPARATRGSAAASSAARPRTRLASGTRCSSAGSRPAAWAPATRFGSRSATPCTGTTSRRSALLSKPGSAGPAPSTRSSPVSRRSAARRRRARGRSSSPSSWRTRGSRVRACPSRREGRSRPARSRPRSGRASAWPTCRPPARTRGRRSRSTCADAPAGRESSRSRSTRERSRSGGRELSRRPEVPPRARLGPDRGRHGHARDHVVRPGRARRDRPLRAPGRRRLAGPGRELRGGRIRQGCLGRDLAAVGRGRRGEPQGGRGARDDQRGPVRRGLAREDPPFRFGRGGRPPRRRRVPEAARSRVSFLSLTDSDREAMLAAVGVSSVEELFRDIPEGVRFRGELDLEPALSEPELVAHLTELAERNVPSGEELSFLGAGIYDHYVPAVVDAVLARGEFLTAYTPYQPEMSQGVLQAIFEYQTAICELTGMDVSNASGYDGTTVAADACYVAKHATGRSTVVLTEATNPQVRQVVKTYAPGFGLGVVEAPGNYGCAMAIGEGQGAGNPLSYGGPHYGFLAAKEEFTRRMPGRIVGETTDVDGERGYVLTLQTREQHIRREKATSNITTNQTLLALAGLVHLSWLGPQGLRETGETCMALAEHAKERIGLPLAFPERTTFKEFAIRAGRPAAEVIREARERGIHPGYALGRDYEGMDDVLLVALTEKRSPAD